MTFIATAKEGFSTVNRNWHLVIIQMATMFFSFAAFFLIVGIPIAIAFIIFGMDFTEILRLRNLESLFIGSAELLNKYFAMALVLFLSLVIYVISVSLVWIFAIAGVAGSLKDSILHSDWRFTFRGFFREGRENFFPVMGFTIIIGILFVLIAFLLGLCGGIAAKVIDTARTQEETLAVFLSIFFTLLLLCIGLFVIFVTLSLTFYGTAYVVFIRQKGSRTFIETIRFILRKPSSVGFYVFLMAGYVVASFLVILISSPFTLIPIIGTILAFPFQILNYFVQSYMSLVMIASMFHFFYRHHVHPLQSIEAADTSPEEAPQLVQPQPDLDVPLQETPQTPPQNPLQ